MQHSYLDKYADKNSLLHCIDPRVKITVFVAFILSVVFTGPSSFVVFAAYGAIIVALIIISQVPPGYVLKRSLVVIPFVLAITIFVPFFKKGEVIGGYSLGNLRLDLTYDGLLVVWNVLVKSYLSVLCMILLTSTTRYTHLLRGLGKLKCPALIVMVLSFMYRYVFLFEDELDKMKQAKAARTIGGSRWFHTKALANILGNLFVRSYERGESVYLAMCARGFDGEIRTMNELKLVRQDFLFLLIMISVLAGIKLLDVWRL
jgi:cobalt/nickel transport system permease protein